jgi:PAS domain S-box-containing protein
MVAGTLNTTDVRTDGSHEQPLGLAQAETLMSELASWFLRSTAPAGVGPKGLGVEAGRKTSPEPAVPSPESLYQALVEQIPAVVFIAYLDRPTSEAYVSPQIEEALGFSQEEWLDDPIRWYERIHPEDKARWSLEAGAFISAGLLKSAYRVIARDGKTVWFRCEAKMVRHDDGRPWFILGVGFDITELKRTEEALWRRTEELQRLSAKLFRLQDQERRRIARDLHDGLGQYLVALKLNFEMLAPAQTGNDRKLWEESQSILERCISDIRTLSYLLHPPMLDDAGLVSAAKWYVEGLGQRSGINATLTISPNIGRLPDALELAIFRVLQESLTNVVRHSGSDTVEVNLRSDENEVSLEVKDYGKGISAEVLERFKQTGSQVGVGLAGMRERVLELGGSFDLTSDHHGTLVRVALPMNRQKHRGT